MFNQIEGASDDLSPEVLNTGPSWDFAFDDAGRHFAYVARIGRRECLSTKTINRLPVNVMKAFSRVRSRSLRMECIQPTWLRTIESSL